MNLKKFITLLIISTFSFEVLAQSGWEMQPVQIQTRWASQVNPSNALKEYPRPQMVRESWQNLNGLWDYTITKRDQVPGSTKWEGQILVPYPIESALSGVKKSLMPDQNLWYRKTISKPELQNGARVLLHFGAVDYEATVFVNDQKVGEHSGGYTAFSIDITDALETTNTAGQFEVKVKVFDPTGEGVGPRGKQVLNPANIYYTPSSGIWQTVWLEVVPGVSIASLQMTPDIDKAVLNLKVNTHGNTKGHQIETEISGITAVKKIVAKGTEMTIPVKNTHLWSPSDPFLYDLVVRIKRNGKVIDEVRSYFGMRKISVSKDNEGVDRIFLNNKPYFNLGTLDQGFWPEGLYTAPTDEALRFDIQAIKAMGFNTIRKHIKVEPARWYYHADKLGILVWQDMVNPNQRLPEGAKEAFERQSAETLSQLHNYPSITTWVLFNEKWGQYDQERLTKWLKRMDPSRIVNGHSGELLYVNEKLRSPSPNAYVSADMSDVHSYPDPMNSLALPGKARVVGEFGGIGVFIPDHQWNPNNAWGYIQEKPAALQVKYTIMNQHLKLFEAEGMSGSIYTQPFDVEGEQNGLMTYDREVIKIPFEALRKIHAPLNPEMGKIPVVTAKDADLTDPAKIYSSALQDYINGRREPAFLRKAAMMASQAGDKAGAQRIGNDYIATMKAPLSEEQIVSVSQFASSTKDAGFAMMNANAQAFKKVMGDRPYTVSMMNMIYKGDIEPMISGNSTDWNAIAEAVKSYGAPGEEMLLRAKTIHFLNSKDWSNYVLAAEAYLKKYGDNVREDERNMLQRNLDQYKNRSSSVDETENASVEATDKAIAAEIINPALAATKAVDKEPDWATLKSKISAKYDPVFAERTVVRAQIFYYYSVDWPKFATAIVNYTEKFEDKNDLKTLNTNANFVLKHSSNRTELQSALSWTKRMVEKEPGNSDYQTTQKALETKLNEQ